MHKEKHTKMLVGTVVSNKMDKTIVVKVERRLAHPLYKKVITRTSKIHAHDPEQACQIGDLVKIAECCPISKTKAWRLIERITANVE